MTGVRQMLEGLGRTALLPFMTAGLPHPTDSKEFFGAMADAGADGFEVGVPYSDPLMDGPVIMRGSELALAAGTTMEVAFSVIEEAAALGKPTLAMTYANPVMQAGWEMYCQRLASCGAAGLIVPDLPLEESGPLREAAQAAGIGLVLFVSPITEPARIERVAAADPAFIYGVADLGVTGERHQVSEHVAGLSARVRGITNIPLVLGVGISTPDQVRAVKEHADGVIVGTALVRRVLDAPTVADAARSLFEAVTALRAALD
ncbi:MAG TPA: tryptophan synthase subunit alpha [Acidimicrobiia bacterium]|nr:tryptophan synthase subunit alpha [Acidimicrobiia bacterium]